MMQAVSRPKRRRTLVAAAMGLFVAGGFFLATAAWADNVTNVDPTSGTSSTQFNLSLPGTAECSGDTASDGYHVYSYVVPSSVNPETLSFASGAGSSGAALIGTDGTPYEAVATGAVTGVITQLPFFSWDPYFMGADFGTGDDLFPGTWNVGIACANTHGQLDIPGSTGNNGGSNFWNYQVTFTAVGTSGDFSWAVAATTTTTTTASTTPTTLKTGATTPTTSSTSVSPTSTPGGGGTSTTLSGGTTTGTTAPGFTGTESGSGTGSASGSADDPAAAGDTETTASSTLAATGSSVTGEVILGVAVLVVGLFVLSFAYPSRPAPGTTRRDR
jgi:hypothetical protein